MNSKKLKTQLLAAVAMTLVAVIALGSSTFAWFANNTEVKATGMNVVAKSNDTFLLISKDNQTADNIQTEGKTSVDLEMAANTEVFPAAPARTEKQVNYLAATTGKKVDGNAITVAGVKIENAATAAAVTNWYTAKAENEKTHTMKDGSARQLENFDEYVVHQTLYMTVAKGADGANNLKVTPTFKQKGAGVDASAVKVLLVTNDNACEILTKDSGEVNISGGNTTLTEGTVRQVDLYIYVDGDESVVHTNNKAKLTGVDIELAFNVEVATA